MNKSQKSFSVDECKVRASLLLKSLRSRDQASSQKAAKRFQHLPEFGVCSFEEILQADIKRKHALAVIAIEKGFTSWSDLKCQLPFIRGGFLNQWFANYADAKSYQHANSGFLLPFKNQFFMCDADYIVNLGFDAEDPDWALIGYDWAHPADKNAWQRLYKKWIFIQGGSNE
ncbi:MAG: hypothetical protein H0X26_06510 [Alphaproteobacteria bacterium]|nr:hypothetical protein [Alphaproteobacteria bacterium]